MPDFSAYEGNWTGVSFFNLIPVISQFQPPSGVLMHSEVGKLLPNYANPSTEAEPIYEIERGGIYPSLPRKGAVNFYLNITWLADCGSATNC